MPTNPPSPLPPVKLALFTAFNAMVIHQSLSISGQAGVSIPPLSAAPTGGNASFKSWLLGEWTNILRVANHEPVFDLAVVILEQTPAHPQIERVLKQLAQAAEGIVASKALLKHDISGRIYHRLLLPEVAKGLATFYTSLPAAYLLARLAVETPGFSATWSDDKPTPVVVDLACGSGTLISAAYTALLDEWTERELHAGEDIDEAQLLHFHRSLLQDGLYGFDVLEYATHLAASWLTLRMPEAEVRHMNVYTLPLGGKTGTWLGSLSAQIRAGEVAFPQARSLTGETVGAEAAGMRNRSAKPVSMPRPDLVIMNPPFARTGNVGKSILMGHLPPEERARVLEALGILAQRIKSDLGESFGNAGLAPMFVWLGGNATKDGGRIAFVLPRVLLGGVFWEAVREFLEDRFRLDHIVLSDDPSKSWAWSENTQLSEVLLVATKGKKSGVTRVTYVRHRPRSALEGKILASRILSLDSGEGKRNDEDQVFLGTRAAARSFLVDQSVLRTARNWNIPIGFASSTLNRETLGLFAGPRFLDSSIPAVPLSKLLASRLQKKGGKAKSVPLIGYDVSPYSRHVKRGGPVKVDALEGANEKTLHRLEIAPNTAHGVPATDFQFIESASRLLIAGVGRFWLYTIPLVSVTCSRPAVSNTMWSVRLKGKAGAEYPTAGYKAQSLWLNSTPGLLGLLGLRQDNKGAFVQLKKEYVPLIPMLDYLRLSEPSRDSLDDTFGKLAKVNAPSLPVQIREATEGKGFRFELDSAVLDAVAPKVDRRLLRGVYQELLNETTITPQLEP
jgi:hypothetical protein